MERKRFKRRESQEGFFSDDEIHRTKEGMQDSVDKLVGDVKNHIIPALREAGFNGRVIRGREFMERKKEKEHEGYADIHPRLLINDSSWWLEIWNKKDPGHRMVVKPFVIESSLPIHLKDRPRLDLPRKFLKRLNEYHENIWYKIIWTKFFILDLKFLIVTKTHKFWLGSYYDISDGNNAVCSPAPPRGWTFTYRNNVKWPDRIAIRIKSKVQEAKFKIISREFKKELTSFLYYWSKNNPYDANK